jgi:hypothetical protein
VRVYTNLFVNVGADRRFGSKLKALSSVSFVPA